MTPSCDHTVNLGGADAALLFPGSHEGGKRRVESAGLFSTKKFSVAFRGRGEKGGVAWSSKNLHPKNDPRLRPGHSKPFPQLQTTASRFAYSNFGEDALGTHGRGSLLHRAGVGRHGQIHDGQRLSPFRVIPRGPAKGLTEHRIRASRVKPTELDAELGRPQRPSTHKTSEILPAEVE